MGALRAVVNEELDRALIERIAAGDEAAFSTFYDRHARRVLAFVRERDRASDKRYGARRPAPAHRLRAH